MATLHKYNPLDIALELKPRDDSNAEVWSQRLFTSEDEKQFHGVWQAAPGVHANLPGQETVVILEGRATVSGLNRESIDVAAGDLVFVDAGEVATWTVHEQLRKVFVINS
ncbi:cupin domain-containing protein [Arthrobacter sp. OAP107]|uniref:cupin domain-containing protein n=1 Tax=Arthrobacter sp. OAP107 TaxID=3156445 RepID=UPI0033948D65